MEGVNRLFDFKNAPFIYKNIEFLNVGAAKKNLATVSVPRDVLKDGVNRIAVEEHANYAGAVSVSFDLKGSLLR